MPERVINPILFLPNSMSIYSPLLSAGAGLGMVCMSMCSTLQAPQPSSCSLGISAASLSLKKGSLGHMFPRLLPVWKGQSWPTLHLYTPVGTPPFHGKWEKVLFSPRGVKSAREKVYQHISHAAGEEEAKRIHYSGSPASSLVNPYHSGMPQK